MTTQIQANGSVVATAVPDPIHEALTVLVKSAGQTNQLLQELGGEIRVMNRQLFDGRPQPLQPAQGAFPGPVEGRGAGGPVATIVPDGQPQQNGWRKQVIKSTCAQIGVTKTRSLSKWKINFYVDGEGRPASAYARRAGEFASLIQRARGVWPEISPDHFSTELFTQRNKEWQEKGSEGNYEELFIAPQPFLVEWYEQPGNDGKTYAYIERVYPC
jgi:hypothetical protein